MIQVSCENRFWRCSECLLNFPFGSFDLPPRIIRKYLNFFSSSFFLFRFLLSAFLPSSSIIANIDLPSYIRANVPVLHQPAHLPSISNVLGDSSTFSVHFAVLLCSSSYAPVLHHRVSPVPHIITILFKVVYEHTASLSFSVSLLVHHLPPDLPVSYTS